MLANDVRGATCTSVGAETVCFLLNRNDFTRLLGPLDELIREESNRRHLAVKSNTATTKAKGFFSSFFSGPMDEEEEEEMASKPVRSLTGGGGSADKALRATMQKQASAVGLDLLQKFGAQYHLNQFAAVQLLYDGMFSSVKLVQHTETSKTFALKVFKKQALFENNLERAPLNEKEVLVMFDYPYIPGCYAVFKDANALYLLMELLPGGDMWSLLYGGTITLSKNPPSSHLQGLTLKDAMFYIVNVITVLLHIHEKDVAYRDLKPENLVVDKLGYVKVVDFGNAKYLPAPHMANTMCGSPEVW